MPPDTADIQADIEPVPDRHEAVAIMEPLLLGERFRGPLSDLALDLAMRAAGLRRSLPAGLVKSLADLVRVTDCHYSNLIKGHDTHPVDIERSLKGDYSQDPAKRDLQLEARAHIEVQAWIDRGGIGGRAFTLGAVREVHERFCALLPPDLLLVEDPVTRERIPVVAGALRRRDVQVGRHIAISPAVVPRFLERFETVYSRLGKVDTVLATAAAHHRLLWIHPFLDGNGRVARLQSHAVLLDVLDTGGVWSIARGLARNVATYKHHLAQCDLPRRNDLDGRGSLSEENLAEFTRFFLETCIDQVRFMEGLMQPDTLRTRILLWADEETRLDKLPPKSRKVLEALLFRGTLPRGDVAEVVGTGDRQARRIVAALAQNGVFAAGGVKEPLRLAFPAALASRWMPGLFPEKG